MKKNSKNKVNLKIEVPKGNAFAYETHDDLPQMHQQNLCVGKRGSGKTVAVINLIQKLCYDRIFVISPTFKSNRNCMELLDIDEDDVYEDVDDITCVDNIQEKIKEEAEEYDMYHEKLAEYKKFLKLQARREEIPDDLLMMFFDGDKDTFTKPFHWLDGRRPRLCLICDDILGSKLFSKGLRKMNNLAILHRHCGPVESEGGGALGISIYYLTQSYTIQHGGISKCIRNNCTSLILFKTKNEREFKQIQEECSGEVDPETFKQMYDYAVEKPHSFLFVDLHPKKNHPSQFRCCFDEFLNSSFKKSTNEEEPLLKQEKK